jgi:hypothetical protein
VLTNVETAEEFDSNKDEAYFLGNFPAFVFEGQQKNHKTSARGAKLPSGEVIQNRQNTA